jgi:hypothetical protein
MERKLKNSVIIAFGMLVIFGCKKEKPPIPLLGVGCSSTHCPEMYQKRTSEYPDTLHFTDTPPNCMTMFEETYTQKWIYFGLSINPKNKFEFVIARFNPENSQTGRQLCIHNLCNNKFEILTDNALGAASWSINDWILYIGYDLHLYRIKPDGSEKENLSNGGVNKNPKWSPDGTKFVYKNITDNPNRLRICDENGELIKTITGNINSWNWRSNGEIIFTDDGYIKVFDLEDESVSTIMNQPIENLENLENAGLIPIENRIYFNSFNGLNVLENNGDNSLIEESYLSFDIIDINSLDDDHLIFSRATIDTSAYPCTTKVTFYTSIYDIETQSERYIKKLTELK